MGRPKRLTATELRTRLYAVLDEVAETGEPVEIVRGGKTLRIVVETTRPKTFAASRLVAHPGAVVGAAEDLVHLDWSHEWHAFPDDAE